MIVEEEGGGVLPEEEALKAMVTSAEDEATAFEMKNSNQESSGGTIATDNHIPAGLQSRKAYTKVCLVHCFWWFKYVLSESQQLDVIDNVHLLAARRTPPS